jgi:hypothetical protein
MPCLRHRKESVAKETADAARSLASHTSRRTSARATRQSASSQPGDSSQSKTQEEREATAGGNSQPDKPDVATAEGEMGASAMAIDRDDGEQSQSPKTDGDEGAATTDHKPVIIEADVTPDTPAGANTMEAEPLTEREPGRSGTASE